MAETFVVRLAHHRIGFYDPLNHLHLSKGLREEAELSASIDLRHIRPAVKSGALIVVAGSLPEEVKQAPEIVEPVLQSKEATTTNDEQIADIPVAETKEAPVKKGRTKRG